MVPRVKPPRTWMAQGGFAFVHARENFMALGPNHLTCDCCASFLRPAGLGRRGFMAAIAGAAAAPMVFTPAWAEDGTAFDSMLLTCIDPRFVTPVYGWMEGKGLKGRYSQFAIAGSAVGVVAPAFAA